MSLHDDPRVALAKSLSPTGIVLEQVRHVNVVLKVICGSLLNGSTPEEKAQVDSWLSATSNLMDNPGAAAATLAGMEKHLQDRAYLAGSKFTLADAVGYLTAAPHMEGAAAKFLNVARWFDQVQHQIRAQAPNCKTLPALLAMGLQTVVPLALPSPAAPPAAASAKAPAAAAGGKPSKANKAAALSPASGALPPPPPPPPKDTTAANGAPAADSAAAAATEAGASSNKNDKKKDKGKAETAAALGAGGAAAAAAPATDGAAVNSGGASADTADVSKLDMRVGVITKAWAHPEAEKLFCEEIDIGEAEPRTIASGLRPFYSEPEMQGRRVLVLANLKPRTMVGFKSNGMVLCASSGDHTVVRFVEPPADAVPGARVTAAGFPGEPAVPTQVAKKKILEACLPLLRTDTVGTPCFSGVPLEVEGVGLCTSPLSDATVG